MKALTKEDLEFGTLPINTVWTLIEDDPITEWLDEIRFIFKEVTELNGNKAYTFEYSGPPYMAPCTPEIQARKQAAMDQARAFIDAAEASENNGDTK